MGGWSVIMNNSQKQRFKVRIFKLFICFFTHKLLIASQNLYSQTGVMWITWELLGCFYQLLSNLTLKAPIRESIGEQVMQFLQI